MSETGQVPDVVTCIDLGAIVAFVEQDEGDLLVVVHDGEVGVRLELGGGGGHAGERAILGAERLVTVLVSFVDQMRERAGLASPDLPTPAVTDPRTGRVYWPPNAFGYRMPAQHDPGS